MEILFLTSPSEEFPKPLHISSRRLPCTETSHYVLTIIFILYLFFCRDKVLDDVRRLIQPCDVIGRTVYDLDEPRWVT